MLEPAAISPSEQRLVHGASDEYGVAVASDRVHVHDFHATILDLLGLDHERLTFRHAGRDYRLTDVHGRVVREILASCREHRGDALKAPAAIFPLVSATGRRLPDGTRSRSFETSAGPASMARDLD